MSGEVELSLVLPVYNEVESLPVLWRELAEVLPGLAAPAEVIFVDDGSTDGSDDVLRRLAKDDQRIRVIRFAENVGLSAAFYAGLQAARGRIIATMDSDLQNDPRDLGMLMSQPRRGRCGGRLAADPARLVAQADIVADCQRDPQGGHR